MVSKDAFRDSAGSFKVKFEEQHKTGQNKCFFQKLWFRFLFVSAIKFS